MFLFKNELKKATTVKENNMSFGKTEKRRIDR